MNRRIIHACIATVLIHSPGLAAERGCVDIAVPAGRNYSVAAFRFWLPPEARVIRGVTVLVPGSNSDGRAQASEAFWQTFASRHGFAIVGCFFKDHPHENMNIEEYARAGDGSGPALLEAIRQFAGSSGHQEVEVAPLLLWGISAGGEFNYEFSCWKPERVLAFVVNKGGYYFTHLAPAATRAVPGIFFIGARDLDFRIRSIEGIFAINHEVGARWKLLTEPNVGHEVGNTRQLSVDFFDTAIADGLAKAVPESRPRLVP